MVSSLEILELVEKYAVIHFWISEGVNLANIYSSMTKQCRKSCMNYGNFYQWVEQLKNGQAPF